MFKRIKSLILVIIRFLNSDAERTIHIKSLFENEIKNNCHLDMGFPAQH